VIVVPYTRLDPGTARLADLHAPGHVRIRIDPADQAGYWRLLAGLWLQPGDLTVIEHDIGIRAGVTEGLADCREPWCGHPYQLARGIGIQAALGCTRFTGDLKAAEPDLLDVAGEAADFGIPARDWRRLDVRIAGELGKRGYVMHVHEPQVAHYHRY
jgi:hypothetical protein